MIYSDEKRKVQNEVLEDILRVEKLRLANPDEKGWCLRLDFGTFWVTDEPLEEKPNGSR